jgi:iron complex transport system ATP-binding protein
MTIRAEHLRVVLGERTVLHDVSCSFEPGWTAVVGPNGAGKSTLLRALAGLLKPASGQVTLHGKPLTDYAPSERGQAIAWLAQQGETTGDLTARETVHLGRLPHIGLFGFTSARTANDDAIVDAALAATESTAWQHRRLIELSGGERQRVLLSRALATESPVLLLDEPTTHLDPPHQVALARLFRRLASTHTVITVLHDLPLAVQADRLLVMRDGAIAGDGASNDAALHAVLVEAFDHAIAVIAATAPGKRPAVSLRLDN